MNGSQSLPKGEGRSVVKKVHARIGAKTKEGSVGRDGEVTVKRFVSKRGPVVKLQTGKNYIIFDEKQAIELCDAVTDEMEQC